MKHLVISGFGVRPLLTPYTLLISERQASSWMWLKFALSY